MRQFVAFPVDNVAANLGTDAAGVHLLLPRLHGADVRLGKRFHADGQFSFGACWATEFMSLYLVHIFNLDLFRRFF